MKTPEIREAPVPVGHDWTPFNADGSVAFEDSNIAERFCSKELVDWHQRDGFLPCRVFLSNGQTIIVRAKP